MGTVFDPDLSHILVVTPSQELSDRIQILSQQKGYHTRCFLSPEQAIYDLKSLECPSYAMIITCFRMPGIKGDEVLNQFRERFPESPRILIADAFDLNAVVHSLNKAGIFACLLSPFADHEFIGQVERGMNQFKAVQKKNHLMSVTNRQNTQLVILANKLRKEHAANQNQVKKRLQILDVLDLKLRTAKTGPSLPDLLHKKRIVNGPEAFTLEFLKMKSRLKHTLEQASGHRWPIASDIQHLTGDEAPPPILQEDVRRLLTLFFISSTPDTPDLPKTTPHSPDKEGLHITISSDRTQAFIRMNMKPELPLTPDDIRRFLCDHEIYAGIKADDQIQAWMDARPWLPGALPFLIAQGVTPRFSKDAEVIYHFPIKYLCAGRLKEDGCMDFRQRGDIPFVVKGTLLAEKKNAKPGIPGMDISGNPIPVQPPMDIPFEAGPGVIASENGNILLAAVDGQPMCDAMGVVSVFSELSIDGDVGFDTGNINYAGHIRVKGVVRPGFTVKGVSLEAEHIEGAASIDLTGDLCVKNGIVNTPHINVLGSVNAGYIHHSSVDAFGDLTVLRELIDSEIRLGGKFINDNGTIISSRISAKMGVFAGAIGTESASSVHLVVGVDAYIRFLLTDLETRLHKRLETLADLEHTQKELEIAYNDLHGSISSLAYTQDRCILNAADYERKLKAAGPAGDPVAIHQLTEALNAVKQEALRSEEAINMEFKRQDAISLRIAKIQTQIKEINQDIEIHLKEKDRLFLLSKKNPSIPEVRIRKTASPGTRIETDHTAIILKEPFSRCRITEVLKHSPDMGGDPVYEMRISYE